MGAPASSADSTSYCEAFARDLANRKLLVDASIKPAAADPQGKAVATSISGSTDAANVNRMWRRAYRGALDDCLTQYSKDAVTTASITQAVPKPAKPVVPIKKAEVDQPTVAKVSKPNSESVNKACQAKHPTYDSKTGMYRTWSGAQRKCQL